VVIDQGLFREIAESGLSAQTNGGSSAGRLPISTKFPKLTARRLEHIQRGPPVRSFWGCLLCGRRRNWALTTGRAGGGRSRFSYSWRGPGGMLMIIQVLIRVFRPWEKNREVFSPPHPTWPRPGTTLVPGWSGEKHSQACSKKGAEGMPPAAWLLLFFFWGPRPAAFWVSAAAKRGTLPHLLGYLNSAGGYSTDFRLRRLALAWRSLPLCVAPPSSALQLQQLGFHLRAGFPCCRSCKREIRLGVASMILRYQNHCLLCHWPIFLAGRLLVARSSASNDLARNQLSTGGGHALESREQQIPLAPNRVGRP